MDEVNKIVKKFHQSIDPHFKNGAIYENFINLSFFEKKENRKKGKWLLSNYNPTWLQKNATKIDSSSTTTHVSSSAAFTSGSKISAEPWEMWSIKVNVHFAENEQQMNQFRGMAEKQLRACLLYISSLNISEIFHIPSHHHDEAIINSFKIIIANDHQNESWTGLLKKMITDSNSFPSILK